MSILIFLAGVALGFVLLLAYAYFFQNPGPDPAIEHDQELKAMNAINVCPPGELLGTDRPGAKPDEQMQVVIHGVTEKTAVDSSPIHYSVPAPHPAPRGLGPTQPRR